MNEEMNSDSGVAADEQPEVASTENTAAPAEVATEAESEEESE